MRDLEAWAIGPLEQSPLDICLKDAFPQAHFFDYDSPPLDDVNLLLLEPLSRPLPGWVWEHEGPRVGLGSWPAGFHFQASQRILEALDDFLPLESRMATHCAKEALWAIHPHCLQAQRPPQIFERAYVLDRSYSQHLMQLENEPQDWVYFQEMLPARLPFYFKHSQQLRLDLQGFQSLHWQALASGAEVFVPANTPVAAGINREQASPDWIRLSVAGEWPWLKQELPKRLDALGQLSAQGSMTHPRALEGLQLALCHGPQALTGLKKILNILPPGQERLLLCCLFFQRLLTSPFRQGSIAHILQQEELSQQALVTDFDAQLAQIMRSWLSQDYAKLCQQLEQFDSTQQRHSQTPGAWLCDPLYLGLESLYPQQALALFCAYQGVIAKSFCGHYQQALKQLEDLLERAYLPWACDLWLQLRSFAPTRIDLKHLLQRHPQQVKLLKQYHQEDIAQAKTAPQMRQSKLALGQALDLTQRMLTQHSLLEDLWALERLGSSPGKKPPLALIWEGSLDAYSSLASINQHWCSLLQEDPEVQICHLPFGPPELPRNPKWQALKQNLTSAPDILISHRWPHRDKAPLEGHWVNIVPWEFGLIPHNWAQKMNQELDRVWVPSAYVARSFAHSGVHPHQIAVIPNGVDTQHFSPEGDRFALPTQKSFCFLFVGGTVYRKGVDLLKQAFQSCFSGDDDVALIIKAFGTESHYVLAQENLNAAVQGNNPPEIHVISDDLSPTELAALYRSCQVYVHPYRGEGFGMPILEAMACGLPVIIPNAGPAPEFAPPETSWQVWTRLSFEPHQEVHGQGQARSHPYFSVCDLNHLQQCMREAFENEALRLKRQQAALAQAQSYDWQQLYALVKTELFALKKRPQPQRQSAEQHSVLTLPVLNPLKDKISGPFTIDFTHFHPEAPAQALVDDLASFNFLCLCDWEQDHVIQGGHLGWQDLLLAYCQSFKATDDVNLMLKALGGADFDTKVEALMNWFETQGIDPAQIPPLTFIQEELNEENLPGLYRSAQCFVTAHNQGSGIWSLMAQACAVPVISCGHFPFLKRPLSEVFEAGDIAHLSWLLQQHVSDLRPERGQIVRQYLEEPGLSLIWATEQGFGLS